MLPPVMAPKIAIMENSILTLSIKRTSCLPWARSIILMNRDFLVNEYINFMGGMSNLMRSGAIRINSGSSAVPISNGLSDGDTKTNGIGLNFNRDFTKKTRLNATYFYNSIDNLTNQEINRNYFQREGDFSTDETDVTSSENQNHRISAKFDHEIDSTQSIRATASLSFNDLTYSTYLQNKTLSADNILQNESMIDNSAEGNEPEYQYAINLS